MIDMNACSAILPATFCLESILFLTISLFLYTESYAETDSNTEIKKRDKNESPSEMTKSTLMDQWRQDYNYRYSAEFDEVRMTVFHRFYCIVLCIIRA